jgi:hypothetical protein
MKKIEMTCVIIIEKSENIHSGNNHPHESHPHPKNDMIRSIGRADREYDERIVHESTSFESYHHHDSHARGRNGQAVVPGGVGRISALEGNRKAIFMGAICSQVPQIFIFCHTARNCIFQTPRGGTFQTRKSDRTNPNVTCGEQSRCTVPPQLPQKTGGHVIAV